MAKILGFGKINNILFKYFLTAKFMIITTTNVRGVY